MRVVFFYSLKIVMPMNARTETIVCSESEMETSARSCSDVVYMLKINGAGVRKMMMIAQRIGSDNGKNRPMKKSATAQSAPQTSVRSRTEMAAVPILFFENSIP